MSVSFDSLPPLREVIAAHNLQADKKFGQNFILDQNITDKIARTAGDMSAQTVVEIGPGPGGLTRSLLKAGAGKVVAIEFDTRAIKALESLQTFAGKRLEVVYADALNADLLSLVPQGPRMIVANLPYNIASLLLINWLRQIRNHPHPFDKMVLMFQREVADRLIAAPATKAYGRLSVMTQWLCSARRLFDLPPSVFVPPPKIVSSVVEVVPRENYATDPGFEAMETVVGAGFAHRRKMLRSALKAFPQLCARAGISDSLRAEQLSVEEFTRLARLL